MGSCWSARIKADENDQSSLQAQYASDTINRVQSIKAETVRLSLKSEGEILRSSKLKSFTYNDLRIATRNFRPDSVLGEGGFGCVFKGWIDEHTFAPADPNTGLVIAVKKLNEEGFQGHKEWLTEITYLGQLQHPNLVKLIGYCWEDEQHLLVYEFMSHLSLENHLFNRSSHVEPLSWNLRMKIALGAAKGLAFLHSPKIKVIYRDFKASNILLDSDYNAKLSDFGLAKDGPFGEKSYVSTRVMGTHGYAAPEYMASGHLTTRSDIYSFGVVLLEIMTGRRVLDPKLSSQEENLINWAKPYLKKGNISRIMDSRIQGQYSSYSAKIIGNLVIQCLSVDPRFRPNMNEILSILEQLQDFDQSGDLYPVNSEVKRRYHHDMLSHKTEHERKHGRRRPVAKEFCKVEATISPNFSPPPSLVASS